MTTPAKRFDGFLKAASEKKRELAILNRQQNTLRDSITDLSGLALEVVKEALGFDAEDVVRDDFGSLYRVTGISFPTLYWNDMNPPGYRETLNNVRVRGLLLNAKGVPVWQKERTIHGKLKKYEPEGV